MSQSPENGDDQTEKDQYSRTRILPERPEVARAKRIELGTQIGNYRILECIAAGGFGSVYRAEEMESGKLAALKVLHAHHIDAEVVQRFHREVHVMEMLRHPNVVQSYALGVQDGQPYFAMELLDGDNLRDYVDTVGRLTPAEVLAIMTPLCEVLALAHSRDIVHRDIKASNVFLARDENGARRVVLLDFGIAKMMNPDVVSLTTSRHMIGTPNMMAPEQIQRGPIDGRTDIYALGNLCFLMLTGRLPFHDPAPVVCQQLHLHARPPRPSEFAAVPRALEEVILKAMQKKPEARQQNAGEFLRELAAAVSEGASRSAATDGLGAPTGGVSAAAVPGASALAVYVEIFTSDDDAASEDPAVFDDIETILKLSRSRLGAVAYQPVLETGNSLLMVRPLDAASAARDLADTVWPLVDSIGKRDQASRSVQWNVCLHWSDHAIADGSITDPDISSVGSWSPSEPTNQVVCTAATLTTVGAAGTLFDERQRLYRLTRK